MRKKPLLILGILLSISVVSCSDNYTDNNQMYQTKLLNATSILISNQSKIEFAEMLDGYFEKEGYVLVKEGKDPLTCDYGFVDIASEFGERITNEFYPQDGGTTYYVEKFGPNSDKDKFKEWRDSMLEKGLTVICHKDKNGNYYGNAYTDEELMRLLGSNYSNFTNNKTLSVQEDENLFPLSAIRKDFFKSIDFDFMLFPDSYIIVKLNEDPSICDYGYLLKDSELGRLLGEDIHSDEGTQYVKQFGPDTSKENFDKWSDEMLEDGLIVICEKDDKGQYWGGCIYIGRMEK